MTARHVNVRGYWVVRLTVVSAMTYAVPTATTESHDSQWQLNAQ